MHITIQVGRMLHQMGGFPPVIEHETEAEITLGKALDQLNLRPGGNPLVGYTMIGEKRVKNDHILKDGDIVKVFGIFLGC